MATYPWDNLFEQEPAQSEQKFGSVLWSGTAPQTSYSVDFKIVSDLNRSSGGVFGLSAWLLSVRWSATAWFKSSKKDFPGWRPVITFLYLFFFRSLLRLTSFLSQKIRHVESTGQLSKISFHSIGIWQEKFWIHRVTGTPPSFRITTPQCEALPLLNFFFQ